MMMDSVFGVYDESNGGGGLPSSEPLTPSVIFDNLDGAALFDQNFKMDANLADFMNLDVNPTPTGIIQDSSSSSNEYAELRNVQPPTQQMAAANDVGQRDPPLRDDDGYGSQTLYTAGAMASPVSDEDFSPFTRERCNTWPRQRTTDEGADADQQTGMTSYQQRRRHNYSGNPFSPTGTQPSHGSSGLSLISESNESLTTMKLNGNGRGSEGNAPRTMGQWFLTPADGYEDLNKERLIAATISHHSSAGSDTSDESKRQSPATPLPINMTNYKSGHPSYVELITIAINSSAEKRMTLSEIYDWMVTNVPAFKDQRHMHSSSGWKNSVRHNLSLHSRFKRVKRNGMDKPSWWTVDMTEEVKRDRTKKGSAKQPASRPRANTTSSLYRAVQQSKIGRAAMESGGLINTPPVSRPQQRQQQVTGQMAAFSGSQTTQIDCGLQKKSVAVAQMSKTVMASPVGVLQGGSEHMQWATTEYTKMETVKMDTTDVSNLSQAITVTLSDTNGNGGKPDIALTIMVGDDASVPALYQGAITANGTVAGGTMTNLVHAFRQNSLQESLGRQLLKVKTGNGLIQEVTVPIPMPIRVVVKANAECQTDPEPKSVPAISTATMASGVWPDTEMKQYIRLEDCIMGMVDEKMNGSVQTPLNVQTMAPPPQQPRQHHQPMPSPLLSQQQRQSMPSPMMSQQQVRSPVAMSPSEMMNMYFQPSDAQVMQAGNQKTITSPMIPSAPMSTMAAANASMDDDLTALQFRDNFDGSIMEILDAIEMNCNNGQVNTAAFN